VDDKGGRTQNGRRLNRGEDSLEEAMGALSELLQN